MLVGTLSTEEESVFVNALPMPPIWVLDKLFTSEAKKAARREAERRAKYFVFETPAGELEIKKRYVYYATFVLIALITQFGPLFIAYLFSDKRRKRKKRSGNRPGRKDALDVVVVGCGLPKRGVGWFHLIQLLDLPNVNVRAVVENNRPKGFDNLVQSLQARGVVCVASLADLDRFTKRTLCFISDRSNNRNLILFRTCLEMGASAIYLEKPGAPTVKQLEDMKTLAERRGVAVYIGYNKNFSSYVQNAVKLSRQVDDSHVFWCHSDPYTEYNLPAVFAHNPEGLMKSMAIDELAILVTYFNVCVDNIFRFTVNTKEKMTKRVTVRKPGSPTISMTDFSRAAFKIRTNDDVSVSVMADRCGGNFSFAVVKDGSGKEVQKFEYPHALAAKKLEKQMKADPEMLPYFFGNSNDFLELKIRVVESVLKEKESEGVATIDTGIETMRLAEYANDQVMNALLESPKSTASPSGSPG